MKLAFVIFKYFPYGGAQRDMLRIARDCAARGHEVRIYTGQWRGDPPGEGIEVVLLPVSGGLNHRRHRRLIDAITARLHADEPDLVVGFNRMPGLDVYYAADPCFIERAHAERGWLYRLTGRYRFFAACERAVMGREGVLGHILLLTARERSIYQRWYHTPDARFHVLLPNIPLDDFSGIDRSEARDAVRAEFGLPDSATVILMVGSAFVRKGLDRAIRAVAALPRSLRTSASISANEALPALISCRRAISGVSPCCCHSLPMAASRSIAARRCGFWCSPKLPGMTAGVPVRRSGPARENSPCPRGQSRGRRSPC